MYKSSSLALRGDWESSDDRAVEVVVEAFEVLHLCHPWVVEQGHRLVQQSTQNRHLFLS